MQNRNPRSYRTQRDASAGFTLVELLVVVAIIAMLTLMLLPAVSGTRESARRAQCVNRMGKLVLAIHDFEMNQGAFPSGTISDENVALSLPNGKQQSWTIQTLPFLEETNVFKAIDMNASVYDDSNLDVRRRSIPPFKCPSSSTSGPVSDYAAVHSGIEDTINAVNNGVFFLNSQITRGQITDGLKYTLFLGEKLTDGAGEFGWMAGNRSTLRNTGWNIGTRLPGVPNGFYTFDFVGDDARSTKIEVPEPENFSAKDAQSETESIESVGAQDEDAEDPMASFNVTPKIKTLDPAVAIAIRNSTYVGGFGSEHSDMGAVMALGDGQVKYFSIGTDKTVLQRLGNRSDNQLIDMNEIN